jgi:hypothetical protein
MDIPRSLYAVAVLIFLAICLIAKEAYRIYRWKKCKQHGNAMMAHERYEEALLYLCEAERLWQLNAFVGTIKSFQKDIREYRDIVYCIEKAISMVGRETNMKSIVEAVDDYERCLIVIKKAYSYKYRSEYAKAYARFHDARHAMQDQIGIASSKESKGE